MKFIVGSTIVSYHPKITEKFRSRLFTVDDIRSGFYFITSCADGEEFHFPEYDIEDYFVLYRTPVKVENKSVGLFQYIESLCVEKPQD